MKDDRQQITSDDEAKADGSTDVELWLKKIKLAQDEEKDWREAAVEAIKVYEADQKLNTRFNLFHSNIQTMLPALYNTTPVSDVRRRFNDKDPVGKMAVDIIERSIAFSVDQYPFDKYIKAAQKDAEVAGRGTTRLRLTHEISNGQVIYSEVKCEPVKWDRWGHGPGLYWEEVPFVYFEHDLDKEDVEQLIGDDPQKLAHIFKEGFGDGQKSEKDDKKKAARGVYKTLKIFEIWDKRRGEVLFIAEKITNFPLKVASDELGLQGFFPIPAPLQPIERLGNLTPVVPYDVYKHLVGELDKITRRIDKLVGQLKVRGVVAADMIEDFERIRLAEDGQYVSAKNALALAQGSGGLEKMIAHWPLEPTVLALKQLVEQRELIKQLIYEVTGISDILRGASDANETLGAQQIKTQWGSLRLQDRQAEVARFCRDVFRMKSELICRFEPHVLSEMTGLPQTEQDKQVLPAAIELMRNNLMRRFRIDIETDSTVRADMSRSQEQMNLFMTATAQFVQGLQQAAAIAPQFLPAMIEVYLAFARRFKLGKQAEDAIEGLSQMAPQLMQMANQQQQQNPEAEKAKLEAAREEKKFQIFAETKKAELEFMREKHDMEIEREREKHALEVERDDWLIGREDQRSQKAAEHSEAEHGRKMEMADGEHRRRMEIGDAEHSSRMTETSTKNRIAMKEAGIREAGVHATQDEASVLAEGLQMMAQQQQEATQATVSVIGRLMETLTQHMAEQTKSQREIAAQNMKMATARRRLVKHPDGSKELVMS